MPDARLGDMLLRFREGLRITLCCCCLQVLNNHLHRIDIGGRIEVGCAGVAAHLPELRAEPAPAQVPALARQDRAAYLDRMGVIIDILIAVAMLAVVASLGLGIFSFLKGGEMGRENSNRFMRYRVMSQAVAIILITIGFAYKATHH